MRSRDSEDARKKHTNQIKEVDKIKECDACSEEMQIRQANSINRLSRKSGSSTQSDIRFDDYLLLFGRNFSTH